MSADFAEFGAVVRELAPRSAVVLGSGLGGVTVGFRELSAIPFGAIPGLVPPSIHGHRGQLSIGLWGEVPILLFGGRVHFYEGHPPAVVTGTVRIAADLGVKRFILTNAAGGIHCSLAPGSLMAIRSHIKLLGSGSWRALAAETDSASLYSARLLRVIASHEADAGRTLLAGTYAALTGPSYETPAEIRALRIAGADAVGMSTAMEAEVAVELGIEIAAISCITNSAAGLSETPLDHAEVLQNAPLAVARLRGILTALLEAE